MAIASAVLSGTFIISRGALLEAQLEKLVGKEPGPSNALGVPDDEPNVIESDEISVQ